MTSDSDFAYLCRKLRERGATVCIVGEARTPDALRDASDQFFEWQAEPAPTSAVKPEPPLPAVKRRPKFVVDAVGLLADSTSEGQVHLGALGQFLKRTAPGFSPKTYGHSGLLDMLRTYDLLALKKAEGGHYTVAAARRNDRQRRDAALSEIRAGLRSVMGCSADFLAMSPPAADAMLPAIMNRADVIALLAQSKPILAHRYGVTRLALFGSTARGDAGAASDVDVLVAFDGPATSVRYFGVQFYLEDLLGRPVDLVTEKAMRAELRPFIEKDAVHV